MRQNSSPESAYNLWPLVLLNSLVFIIFAFSFDGLHTKGCVNLYE